MKNKYLNHIAQLQGLSINLLRLSIFLVMAWIGALKFVPYEAESIVPFVSNSPLMSFFYAHPAPEYRLHTMKEGDHIETAVQWHVENRTYLFSYALGSVIVTIGVLMALGVLSPKIGFIASALTIGMSFTTLSFLVTTPEAWVNGFPFLAGPGRLVIKDLIMLAGAFMCLSDSAAKLSNGGVK